MKYVALLLYAALYSPAICLGQRPQRVIMVDQKERVITTYLNSKIPLNQQTTPNYRDFYLGSPYFGNLVWHQGSLIYRNQREVPAQLAYDLVMNKLYWRLADSTKTSQILPDEFTIEGQRFISDQNTPLGVSQVGYFEVVYDGPTKLLRRWTKQVRFIDPKLYTHRVAFEDRFTGEYMLTKDFYIQKAGDRPRFIVPTEYSLSRMLPNMGLEVANFIAAHSQDLTDQVLVETLMRYDKRLSSDQSQ